MKVTAYIVVRLSKDSDNQECRTVLYDPDKSWHVQDSSFFMTFDKDVADKKRDFMANRFKQSEYKVLSREISLTAEAV